MPTVETNGVETYYETRGSGPPVIFLHGAGGDHRVWAEVTEPLTHDYEVITPDFRLHGKTGGDPGAAITTGSFVEDLHAFIDTLDLDRPALVGLSMGGMVAQRYVDAYPDDVRAVVTLGATTTDARSRSESFMWRVIYPIHDRLVNSLGASSAHRFMEAVLWLRGDDVELSDMEERERIETEHREDYPEQTDAQSAATRDALDDFDDRSIDYEAISIPYLYLYGEKELDTLTGHANFVAETVPGGCAQEIPGAGHHSHVDNPGFVIDTIREFLDEHVQTETAVADGEDSNEDEHVPVE